ncbi:hypothetical protein EYR40_006057 [Pleurotus pulmonarius]|nr:hypothetical protein EYR36_005563 [Pleurotus pulmonarius]KAF4602839.1 hypothetical protein EYR40_006057 [Pleurotus pulmonarius]
MAGTFRTINFDKRQTGGGVPFQALPGYTIIPNLVAPRPYPTLDAVFPAIFPGHDLSKVKSVHANKIGRLGKLLVELIVYIFDATDLEAVIVLGTTNAQLFVIGYRSIVKKGFLSIPEKHRLVQWAAEHEVILELNRCWGLPFPDNTTTDLEEIDSEDERDPVNVVAEYERQDFHLFAYASLMPSLLNAQDVASE